MASSGTRFLIWSLNANMGTAAKGTTLAESIWKERSGIHASADDFGFVAEFGKEAADFGPYFCAAGEAFPVGANEADELIAFVDGGDVVLGRAGAVGVADTIDEEGFDVGLQVME